MSEDDFQDRTEEATPKRKKEAKEQGLVARSREFNSTIVLFCGAVGLFVFGNMMYKGLKGIFYQSFTLNSAHLNNVDILNTLNLTFKAGFLLIIPVLLLIFMLCLLGSLSIGGFSFSFSNLAVKLERMNPINFFTKMLSMQTLVELIKSVLKIILVTVSAFFAYKIFAKQLLSLSMADLFVALPQSYYIFAISFIILTSSLFIITLIDVPYQLWQFKNKIMMTKQELRDEYRETEGKPEVKAKISRIQRELSKRRMMSYVPKADVILTNPTHFAVALRYDQTSMKAPRVVAKGADLTAQRIIELGKHHDVPIMSLPPLARSLFYFTEIGEEIPSGLYVAVAQVLAYIHQLKYYRKGKAKKPKIPTKIEIPTEYQR